MLQDRLVYAPAIPAGSSRPPDPPSFPVVAASDGRPALQETDADPRDIAAPGGRAYSA